MIYEFLITNEISEDLSCRTSSRSGDTSKLKSFPFSSSSSTLL